MPKVFLHVFTRLFIKIKISHSCRTCVVRVALVSLVAGTRVVKQTRSEELQDPLKKSFIFSCPPN